MKIHRRYIQLSKYIDQSEEEILFDDHIFIDIEVELDQGIMSSTYVDRFPGKENFRKDVIDILENRYGFEVIKDVYDGKLQKGHFSDRSDSISLYLDTYFDLSKAGPALQRLKVQNIDIPESGKIYCFIHLRISDHWHNNEGDTSHRDYINRNANKYTSNRSDITHVIKEEDIEVFEESLYQSYTEALEDLQDTLDVRILGWVRKADRYRRRN